MIQFLLSSLICVFSVVFFFFFKQKTAYEMRISDWSSDVCSSDLERRDRDRANILAALDSCGGKVFGPGGAAELLDVKPTTLASRIKTLGIRYVRANI